MYKFYKVYYTTETEKCYTCVKAKDINDAAQQVFCSSFYKVVGDVYVRDAAYPPQDKVLVRR
jgi:hypothetical protein